MFDYKLVIKLMYLCVENKKKILLIVCAGIVFEVVRDISLV